MKKFNSLQGKMSILLGSSIIGMAVLIAVVTFFSTRSNYRNLLQDRAYSIIESIGPTLELGLYSEEVSMLESPLQGLTSQENILFTSIYSIEGKKLTEKSKIEYESSFSREMLEKVKEEKFISSINSSEGKTFLECYGLIYPLEDHEEAIGVLQIGLSTGTIASAMKKFSGILIAFILLASLLSMVLIKKTLSTMFTPLAKLRKALKEISKGSVNLEDRLPVDTSTREINLLATNFNEFIEKIYNQNRSTIEVAEQMSAQAEELSASSEEMSASSEEVSATMQQIAEASDTQASESQKASEMTQKALQVVRQSLDSARETHESSESIDNLAKEGEKSAREVRLAMDNVTKISHELETMIQEIKQKAESIDGITETVAGISKKTNVLALNATIEASRAGEKGRGFAVVAEEIRKLANQSSESTSKISEIVEESSQAIESLVGKIRETMDEVTRGKETSLESADYLRSIAEEVNHITKRIKEITSVNKQGEEEVKTIAEAIDNIATIAEENAASSEEISAAIEELSASIQELSGTSQETSNMAEELNRLIKS